MKKKLIIPTLGLVTLVGLGILGVGAAKADYFGNGIAQRFSERFGLNEEEVTTFMQEMHQERQETMLQGKEERLNSAVDDGVITEEQKDALEQKWQEKRQEREQHREEMQSWFEEQGIDHQALMQYGGLKHKGFHQWGKSE